VVGLYITIYTPIKAPFGEKNNKYVVFLARFVSQVLENVPFYFWAVKIY
jgi:Na+/H+ antiporter NhaD/arsenite permease-like protein